MKFNTGGPAFPVADPFAVKCPPTDAEALRLQHGMTLRDYFAAKALEGLCAGFPVNDIDWPDSSCPEHYEVAASHAYLMADAMLKAREA